MIILGGTAWPQQVTVHWPDKHIQSQPTSIANGSTVKVVVTDVNDILYDYEVKIGFVTESSSDDLAKVSSLLGRDKYGDMHNLATATPADSCPENIAAAQNCLGKIAGLINAPDSSLNPFDSRKRLRKISLTESIDYWNWKISPLLSGLDAKIEHLSTKCAEDKTTKEFLNGDYATFNNLRNKVNGPHIANGQAQVDNSGAVVSATVTVTESYQKRYVDTYEKTLNYSSNLTLSGGILFSTIRNREYASATVPFQGASATVLGVNSGGRPVPMVVGLLNYRIPHLDWSECGFAFSSGPVIRVAGSTTASPFGYFGGLSFHLWHRLYLASGIHVGQFADFPAGFDKGTTIPANFGALVPVKRWTGHIAFGITYKTNDLGTLTSSGGSNVPSVAALPVFKPAAGSVAKDSGVELSDSISNATIYYTTDGKTPTTASTPYRDKITITGNVTIKAIAIAPGFSQSAVASANYTVNIGK